MAYLLRAKKNIEEQDINEFKVKKEKYLQRRKQKRELKETAQAFEPDGVFGGQIAPPILQKHKEESAFIRYAEYVGTFSVRGTDHSVRSEFVRKQLSLMKGSLHTRPVLVITSPAGVKVTDKRGQTLLMAHAMHRISYCTIIPEENLFCFLSREPKSHASLQYCHTFTTSSTSQVEELNSILGNAFKAAHSAQTLAPPPITFNMRISDKLEEQRELFAEVQRRNDQQLARNRRLMKSRLASVPQEIAGGAEEDSKFKLVLEQYEWYKPKISHEQALDYLLKRDVGAFVVRESASRPESYALSVRTPKNDNPAGVTHYLIEKSSGGVRFKGVDKEWSNLASMVVHHTIMPELLPCTLILPEKMSSADEQPSR